jgi:hypothetical protein
LYLAAGALPDLRDTLRALSNADANLQGALISNAAAFTSFPSVSTRSAELASGSLTYDKRLYLHFCDLAITFMPRPLRRKHAFSRFNHENLCLKLRRAFIKLQLSLAAPDAGARRITPPKR